jgi:hypothetical protein
MKQTWITACVAVGITLAAACGGGGSGATPASKTSGSIGPSSSSSTPPTSVTAGSDDACTLLTDDEVKAVIGAPVTRHEASPKTAASFGCVKGTDRAADVTTTAFVSFSGFTTGAQTLVDQLAAQAGAEEISGLGDRAVFQSAGGLVIVVKGDTAVTVQVFKFGQTGTRDEVIALARTAVSRVP